MPPQFAVRMGGHACAHLTDVLFLSTVPGALRPILSRVALRQLDADCDLLGIGDAREAHGSAAYIALPICGDVDQRVGAHSVLACAALSQVDGAYADDEY